MSEWDFEGYTLFNNNQVISSAWSHGQVSYVAARMKSHMLRSIIRTKSQATQLSTPACQDTAPKGSHRKSVRKTEVGMDHSSTVDVSRNHVIEFKWICVLFREIYYSVDMLRYCVNQSCRLLVHSNFYRPKEQNTKKLWNANAKLVNFWTLEEKQKEYESRYS